jgi:hypothetical protein
VQDPSVKTSFTEEELKVWQSLKKSDRENLDSIFGSDIFEHGLSREKTSQEFSQKVAELQKSEGSTESEMVKTLRDLILKETGLIDQLDNFEKFCVTLQEKIQSKVPHYNLGQDQGLWCVQSLFIVLLKHNGNLDDLILDLKDDSVQATKLQVKIWKKCTGLRKFIRGLENKEQYGNLFLKMSYLLSLTPSDNFL